MICRFRHQHLLPAGSRLRVDNLEIRQQETGKSRIADHPYPIEISSAINSRIHNRPFGHCLDTDKLYRQHCALARLFHHSIEHCRHVDARPEICRTVVGMDTGRYRLLRTLYL